jgi:hypothetical protein
MINWPTAFVIAVAMICGAVLINKPSDAAFGGDGGDGVTAINGGGAGEDYFIHAHKGQLRKCLMTGSWSKASMASVENNTRCTDWLPVSKL